MNLSSDESEGSMKSVLFKNITLSNSKVASRPFYFIAIYKLTIDSLSFINNSMTGFQVIDVFYGGIITLNNILISNCIIENSVLNLIRVTGIGSGVIATNLKLENININLAPFLTLTGLVAQ